VVSVKAGKIRVGCFGLLLSLSALRLHPIALILISNFRLLFRIPIEIVMRFLSCHWMSLYLYNAAV